MVTEDILGVSEVLPQEAWSALQADPSAILVDVRTKAEWYFVGGPDLSALAKDVLQIEWQTYPDKAVNPDFASALSLCFKGQFPTAIYFLCRSGVRSRYAAELVSAAMKEEGRDVACVNVAEGFEGDLFDGKQRGSKNGWKKIGLPWRQT